MCVNRLQALLLVCVVLIACSWPICYSDAARGNHLVLGERGDKVPPEFLRGLSINQAAQDFCGLGRVPDQDGQEEQRRPLLAVLLVALHITISTHGRPGAQQSVNINESLGGAW